MRCGGRPVMSSPSNTTRPPVGTSTPVRQLKNVDLPAPLGPMTARISPRGTAIDTLLSAARPPKRIVRPSMRRMGPSADDGPRPLPAGAVAPSSGALVTPVVRSSRLRERAGRRDDRLLPGDDVQQAVLAVLDVEDELAEERLVVFSAQELVALREVVPLLDLHALERLDELHRVLAAAEAGLLDAELQEVHGLEVRLHVPIRVRTR